MRWESRLPHGTSEFFSSFVKFDLLRAGRAPDRARDPPRDLPVLH
jgi:hypothetical protein